MARTLPMSSSIPVASASLLSINYHRAGMGPTALPLHLAVALLLSFTSFAFGGLISEPDEPTTSAAYPDPNSTMGAGKSSPLVDYTDYELRNLLFSMNQTVEDYFDPAYINKIKSEIQDMKTKTFLTQRICITAAYSLIIVLSFFGNLLVCKVCLKNMTKTNALILSLAASDLTMTLFNIPFNLIRILDLSWPFGSVMCFVVNFVQHLVVYISSYTMAIIAIQRYRSVCGLNFDYDSAKTSPPNADKNGCVPGGLVRLTRKLCSILCLPLSALWACCSKPNCLTSSRNNTFSMRAIFAIIVVTWLASAVISAIFTYHSSLVERIGVLAILYTAYHPSQNATNDTSSEGDILEDEARKDFTLRCHNPLPESLEDFFVSYQIKAYLAKSILVFVTQYFIPLAISCVLYIRIGKIIALQGKLTSIRGNLKARIQQKKKRRRIIMLVLVVTVFAICWLPLNIFHLLTDAEIVPFNDIVFKVCHWLAMSSVCYNPFIYCWLNKNFRKAALKIFCCCCVENEVGGESGREIVFKGKRILLYVPLLGSCLAAKEADKSGDNLQLAMEPTETECVSRVAHPGHKHSSTSVMTEASVVPLSGGPIDEITSIADVASLETKSEIDPSSSSSPLTTAVNPTDYSLCFRQTLTVTNHRWSQRGCGEVARKGPSLPAVQNGRVNEETEEGDDYFDDYDEDECILNENENRKIKVRFKKRKKSLPGGPGIELQLQAPSGRGNPSVCICEPEENPDSSIKICLTTDL